MKTYEMGYEETHFREMDIEDTHLQMTLGLLDRKEYLHIQNPHHYKYRESRNEFHAFRSNRLVVIHTDLYEV